MASFITGNDADFVECASAYLGEAYLRPYGGGWYVDKNPRSVFYGPPAFCLDTEDRTPIQPYFTMTALLHRRTGESLSKMYDAQGRRVQERRAALGPTWRPLRDRVPAVTSADDIEEPPTIERLEWEQGIEQRLASLRARVGVDTATRLDLTPRSLQTLADLVVADYPAGTDFDRVVRESDTHYAQYLTYVGEVMLRAGGGHWVLWPLPTDREPRQTDGEPYVTRLSSMFEWVSERPSLALRGVVGGKPTDLHRRFEYFLSDRE